MFEELGAVIDELDIPADGAALAAVVGLRDRLDAASATPSPPTTAPDCGNSTGPPP